MRPGDDEPDMGTRPTIRRAMPSIPRGLRQSLRKAWCESADQMGPRYAAQSDSTVSDGNFPRHADAQRVRPPTQMASMNPVTRLYENQGPESPNQSRCNSVSHLTLVRVALLAMGCAPTSETDSIDEAVADARAECESLEGNTELLIAGRIAYCYAVTIEEDGWRGCKKIPYSIAPIAVLTGDTAVAMLSRFPAAIRSNGFATPETSTIWASVSTSHL